MFVGKAAATERQYRDVFSSEFNLHFFVSKKDQCNDCVQYKHATDETKAALKEKYESHQRNKELSRALKSADSLLVKNGKNPHISVSCFDMQKVFPAPKCKSNALFYKRKLSVQNCTVYDIGKHQGHCYVWTEELAKRGSNEIASCLLVF